MGDVKCHRSFSNGSMQQNCIREGCSLWDQHHEACGDLVLAAATAKVAQAGLTTNEFETQCLEVLANLAVSLDRLSKKRVL